MTHTELLAVATKRGVVRWNKSGLIEQLFVSRKGLILARKRKSPKKHVIWFKRKPLSAVDVTPTVFECVELDPETKELAAVPPEHRICNGCGGNGRDGSAGPGPCEICVGKGFWSAADIDAYHERHPHVCKGSCGEKHSSPYLGPRMSMEQIDAALKLLDEGRTREAAEMLTPKAAVTG